MHGTCFSGPWRRHAGTGSVIAAGRTGGHVLEQIDLAPGVVTDTPIGSLPARLAAPVVLHNPSSAPTRAYSDAARRLIGEDVPLNIPTDRKGLLGRLFGRRAA